MNSPATPEELTEEQMAKLGAKLALDLGLKRSKEHKDRWETRWGTKTDLGLYRTVTRMMTEASDTLKQSK